MVAVPYLVVLPDYQLQGQHRTIAQLLAKSPSAGDPLISTEARIPMFKELLASPKALEEAIQKNEQYDRADKLSLAIAKMMGGPNCVNQLPVDSFFLFWWSNVLPMATVLVDDEKR